MISIQHVRRLACALLLSAAACGDDGGGDDDSPQPDASPSEAGAVEAGAGDGGTPADGGDIDGGGGGDPDGGDARVAMDTGIPDATGELTQALERAGVRVDARRAELVISAFCQMGVRCNFNDAGVSESTCLSATRAGWAENLTLGYSTTCLDTQLDLLSCTAVTACNQQSACDNYRALQDVQCDDEDAGS